MAQPKGDGNFWWVTLIVVSVVTALVLTFTTGEYARDASAKEAEKIERSLGADTLETVNDLATGWYYASVDKLSIPKDMTEEMAREASVKFFGFESETLWRWLEKRCDAFLDLGYWFYRRVALFIVWIPFWIPMLILASLHGYWDREIKKTDFGYTSPVLNHYARTIMHFVLMVTLLLFVVPVPIDPILFPIFLALATVSAGVALGNVQKRI